jgi:pyrimidine deaminase RibD-like protein
MDTPRCDFWLEFSPQGSRFLLIQNTGAEPAFDVVVCIPSDGSVFKSDVINRLNDDRNWVPCTSGGNFVSFESVRKVLVETLLHLPDGGEEVKAVPVLIRYRTHTQHSCAFHLEIRLPLQNGIQFALPVTGISTSGQQDGTDADRKFARLAIDEARKSVPENDGRPHPWVGAVVVKDGKVLGTAHRGEVPGNHAEFVALERNLPTVAVAGATVYTTLEPCTTRNPPKIPCVDRLIERRVARVVIGILDPDERIRGKGQRKLSNAGIETSLFPHDLAMEVEELNREFTRFCEQHTLKLSLPTTNEDQSNWPDVILECQWPSLVHESRIPGSHIARKRPWMLRYRGSSAVYNVRVHDIDFGEYKASFPSVLTLTDAASVHPIICWKSDGQVITAHDLESLIHDPPSGCDVQQYAVTTYENEGEEIRLEDFILEVEIPVTISYDDKNGNRFKIKYLLRYDTYTEKGEMIRIGKIEKVAPK